MSTLLDEPTLRATTLPAERLRTSMAAVRLSFEWFGVHKTLTPEQRSQAADSFGAEGAFLSAGKKLLDTRHSAYRQVTSARGRIIALWRAMTLPYPEPGLRLIRQDQIDEFNTKLVELHEELDQAVAQLDRRYTELKSMAQGRLGSLFNEAGYPSIPSPGSAIMRISQRQSSPTWHDSQSGRFFG